MELLGVDALAVSKLAAVARVLLGLVGRVLITAEDRGSALGGDHSVVRLGSALVM